MWKLSLDRLTEIAILAILLAALFLIPSTSLYAQQCQAFDRPTGEFSLGLERVITSTLVERPTSMVQQPNNSSRWFVIDQNGVVALFAGASGQDFSEIGVMMDISDRVTRMHDGRDNWNEMGLLSIAAHPDFRNNGYVYLYYTARGPNASVPLYARLSRFTSFDNGRTLDPDSETIVFQLDRDRQFHWGGQMMFNPNDGMFSISIGDGGVRSRSQNRFNLNGSFLRMDMRNGQLPYRIPSDNPYANGGGAPEVYAKGLRNPWRWSIDAETNRIFLGDVGKAMWEEINIIESGENYGWPLREGARCYDPMVCNPAGLTDPIVEYPHDDTGGVAVIGGYVYRGTEMPDFVGQYIYSDSLGRVWSIDTANVDNAEPRIVLEVGPQTFSFAQGADNELYILRRGGEIERLVQESGGNGASSGNNPLPSRLSDTGCFASLFPLQAISTSEPYEVNARLWSDGAIKQRWMNVPNGERITVTDTDDWDFPIGTVLVKNFSLQNQLLETRLFMRHDDGGWAGYSYEWNNQETEATLVPASGSDRQVGSQTWHYPSRIECLQCHTDSIGFTAGPETAQLNKYFRDSSGRVVNQLSVLEDRFDFQNADFSDPTQLPSLADIEDNAQTDHWRSRSYLYANCAMCHQPGGTGRGPEDFRYSIDNTEINAINVEASIDDLGIPNAQLISPGDADNSVMALRMHSLDPTIRMPQIGTTEEDVFALSVIDRWINQLDNALPNSGDTCGEPDVDPDRNRGIYLWKDCSTSGTWHLSALGGGELRKFVGSVVSGAPITIESTDFTQSADTISRSAGNTELSFSLRQDGGRFDNFSFTVDPNETNCLSFDFPENAQIWLGSDTFKVTSNTLNLDTLGACNADEVGIEVRGEPVIDGNTESGIFVWQNNDDSWSLRFYAGGASPAIDTSGSVTSSRGFLSTTEQSIESNDTVDIGSNSIDFEFRVGTRFFDGFDFTVPNNSDLCLLLNDATQVRIGPNKTRVSEPFDLSMLTSGCSASSNGGGSTSDPADPPSTGLVAVGEPDIDGNTESGIFVWQNNDDSWSLRFYAGGASPAIDGAGSVTSSRGFLSTTEQSVESNDTVDTGNNSIDFEFRVGTRFFDGFDFTVENNADLCVMVNDPSIEVRIGPNKTLVSAPFNLSTLTSGCDANSGGGGQSNGLVAVGEPDIDGNTESGIFVWQNNDDSWSLRFYAGGASPAIDGAGSVTSSRGFLSTTEQSIESNDTVDTGNNSIDFEFRVGTRFFDGFDFTVENNADLCVMVDDSSIEVRIGPNKTLVSAPFNLSTLTSGCSANPTTGLVVVGEPNINGSTESGIFVWQDTNDTWSLRLHAGPGTAITTGSITSTRTFLSTEGINLETNDVLDTSDPEAIEFSLRVGAGAFDGIDFRARNNPNLCLMVDNASIEVRIGPNKTLVTVPFSLSNLDNSCG